MTRKGNVRLAYERGDGLSGLSLWSLEILLSHSLGVSLFVLEGLIAKLFSYKRFIWK